MTVHFNANLRPVVKERVGMLHWITDPACSGFIIAYDLDGNQVLISNFDVRYSEYKTIVGVTDNILAIRTCSQTSTPPTRGIKLWLGVS